jgi:hypothetical protein
MATDDSQQKMCENPLVVFSPVSDQYHWVSESDNDKTACGFDLSGREDTIRFSDPGDLYRPCEDCRLRAGDASIDELVNWIANQADFTVTYDSPPSYLNREQLEQLKDYIVDLKTQNNE